MSRNGSQPFSRSLGESPIFEPLHAKFQADRETLVKAFGPPESAVWQGYFWNFRTGNRREIFTASARRIDDRSFWLHAATKATGLGPVFYMWLLDRIAEAEAGDEIAPLAFLPQPFTAIRATTF